VRDDFWQARHLQPVTAIPPLRLTRGTHPMKEHSHIKIVGQFCGHIAIGVLMFTAALLGAVATKNALTILKPWLGDQSLLDALHLLEGIFLWADICFLAWWCVFSTLQACKALCKTM